MAKTTGQKLSALTRGDVTAENALPVFVMVSMATGALALAGAVDNGPLLMVKAPLGAFFLYEFIQMMRGKGH